MSISTDHIREMAGSIREEIVTDRRNLHQIPEIGTDLPQTSAYIKKRLDEMGIPWQDYGGPLAQSGARLLNITWAQYSSEWNSTMHAHRHAEMFFIMSGSGTFQLQRHSFPVSGRSLVIINPGVMHCEQSNQGSPLEYIVLGVDGLDFTFSPDSQDYALLNYREGRSEIVFFLHTLVREAGEQPRGWEDVCQHLLEVLLTLIVRHTHFTMQVEPARRTNKECAAARRYIDEHFAEPITLSLLASVAHVNKYYLVHAFNKEYGISPINYLIERRIRESKYMLENTDHTLSQIAHMLGFSSPSYFSQSFRRITKQSPMEYRKKSRAARAANAAQQAADGEEGEKQG